MDMLSDLMKVNENEQKNIVKELMGEVNKRIKVWRNKSAATKTGADQKSNDTPETYSKR